MRKGVTSENPRVSRVACEAAQKLVLYNLLPPEHAEEIVKAFTLLYFDPEASLKPAVTQALSYFMPVFCHSKIRNAQLMANVAVPAVSKLLHMRDEIVEDEEAEMVGWPIITGHLSDWTDGRKVVGQIETGTDGKTTASAESELPHLLLAINVLERALTSSCSKEERKPLLSLLTKLHISPTAPKNLPADSQNNELLETLQGLVSEAVEDKLGVDATQRNALAKIEATLTKRIGDAADATLAAAAAQDEEEDREETATPETATAAAAARGSVARSVAGSEMDVDDDDDEDSLINGLQGEGTRMPLGAGESEEEEEEEDEESTPRAVRPSREEQIKTEMDIMDELLASEDEDEEMTM